MTDCLLHAFYAHLRRLGIQPHERFDKFLFDIMRDLTHEEGSPPVSESMAPFIVQNLASQYDLVAEIQHVYRTQAHHAAEAENEYQSFIIEHTDYGQKVDIITLEPAIYCLLSHQHAVFADSVPQEGTPAMAIKLIWRNQ